MKIWTCIKFWSVIYDQTELNIYAYKKLQFDVDITFGFFFIRDISILAVVFFLNIDYV